MKTMQSTARLVAAEATYLFLLVTFASWMIVLYST